MLADHLLQHLLQRNLTRDTIHAWKVQCEVCRHRDDLIQHFRSAALPVARVVQFPVRVNHAIIGLNVTVEASMVEHAPDSTIEAMDTWVIDRHPLASQRLPELE
jgi:hypothetical protein